MGGALTIIEDCILTVAEIATQDTDAPIGVFADHYSLRHFHHRLTKASIIPFESK